MEEIRLDSILADTLRLYEWKDGLVIRIVRGSNRHRIVVTCYGKGRQKAEFANGEHNYGAYVEITRDDGSWISHGMNVVPVLPDGRLLMVVEQRPPQGRFKADLAKTFVCAGKEMHFDKYGPYSSLEFPGGAVDATDKSFTAAWMRELTQETGIHEQNATLYKCNRLFFQTGADVAIAMHQYVVELSHMNYEKFVEDDGGLSVLALTPDEVQENIWNGAIVAAQAGLRGWSFYLEVMRAKANGGFQDALIRRGYLTIEQVRIKLP